MSSKYLEIMLSKASKLHEDGNPSAARLIFEELEVITPDEPSLQYHLGMVCMELHDNHAAYSHFKELVRLQPDFLEGRMLLGMACGELGRHEEAIYLLREVLDVCPDVTEIHHRLGLLLADRHHYEEAYHEYQEVLRLSPEHTGVLCSLGLLFTTTGQIGEARKFLLKALEKSPDALDVINNLGRVCKIGRAEESLKWFQRGLDIDPEDQSLTSNYLYTLNYIAGLSPEFIAAKYREYAPRAFHPPKEWQPQESVSRHSDDIIRVGYVSADFYGHSVAFFLEPVFKHHDKSRFEVFCYYNRTVTDETTDHLKKNSHGWRCIFGISDIMVADMIIADRIDILVDLSGHTSGHRLGVFALRPAPVQISWIGHPNTTGLPQMDYYLTDAWCDPPGMTEHLYSEKLYRLPKTFCCYLPPVEFPPVAPVPSTTSGEITLGCFNSMAKINNQLISWWAQMLNKLPNAKMFIKGPALDDKGTRDELYECFAACKIPEEQLLAEGVTNTRKEHLGRYALVDIALDTFPYHGTTTTCEALWMGVPVVTLAGNTHVSRVGVSLLHSIGCDDLIAETPDEYIAKVVLLAKDRQRQLWLRQNLRTMMAHSPLMDAADITRDVENAYIQMFNERNEI